MKQSNGSAKVHKVQDWSTIEAQKHTHENTPTVHPMNAKQNPYAIALPGQNPTLDRVPFIPRKDGLLADSGTPRANIAPSVEHPNGSDQPPENGGLSWNEAHKHKTVLQSHISYWDKDSDGIIWPIDTYNGIRAWGWNILLTLFAVAIINGGLSYATTQGLVPDPFFRLDMRRIHKAHHGSTSGSFDAEGRFNPQAFENIWAKYDKSGKGGLTFNEIFDSLSGQRMFFDPFGAFATLLEWMASYLLIWPEDGVLRKEDMRKLIEGSLFQEKADEYAKKTAKKY